MKRWFAMLLAAAITLSMAACTADKPAETTPPPVAEILPEPEDPIDLLLNSMTIEEKVGQLFFVRVPADRKSTRLNSVTDVSRMPSSA